MAAAGGVAEDPAVQAARILLTLRSRRLLRWPEWVDKEQEPPVAAAAVVEARWPLEGWPKRQRGGRRFRSGWQVDTAMEKLGLVASSSSGSGASSSGEERERSPAPARWKERPRSRDELPAAAPRRRPDSSPAYYVSKPAGSGPSTSADRKARPRHAAADKVSAVAKASAAAAVAAMPTREPVVMKASSPETPLDFGADAAGSGASSSGDDAARPPSKRRAPGSGASSGDEEGCSSQDKRARVDAGHGDGDGKKAISEPKIMQEPKKQVTDDDSDKGVKFAFDLNMPCPEDDFC